MGFDVGKVIKGEEHMRDTIDMAREAGIDEWWDNGGDWRETFNEHLKAFEALVRADAIADEREACAKTKSGKPRELKAVGRGSLLGEQQFCFEKGWREGAASVRAAIRARGNT
jgi:hypothetical protein